MNSCPLQIDLYDLLRSNVREDVGFFVGNPLYIKVRNSVLLREDITDTPIAARSFIGDTLQESIELYELL